MTEIAEIEQYLQFHTNLFPSQSPTMANTEEYLEDLEDVLRQMFVEMALNIKSLTLLR